MITHVGVLPLDVLDALSPQLGEPSHARFLRLPHPRTGIPSLFLPCPGSTNSKPGVGHSILEVQAVAPPDARSWRVPLCCYAVLALTLPGYADGKLLVMTPMDPAFLLIPILRSIHSTEGKLASFRPMEDIFDDATQKVVGEAQSATLKDPSMALSLSDLERLTSLNCMKDAMKRICEYKEVTPEIIVYRYSPTKLVEYLRTKVTRLSKPEVFEGSKTLLRGLAKEGLMEDGKEGLLESARTKAACNLISQYIPTDIHVDLLATYDFTNLDKYLQSLQAEAEALSVSNTNATRTKGKGKKAEQEEGKKRKAPVKGSHSVEQLKKVNTRGMAKLSTFFQKPKA
ncbi:hypothetical protein JAAARDRAFT_130393 [Jaapia argillacea MUCL 33604]|uniref:Ribonuclease H2 subunit B n=1 Tax=Jaapia argillacea MUCL 33604 TaxID=933084 RepID=A0A067PSP6_9AGAM|nr:hypothetical protein JAAARDRAFT_130393 [Jaapia argillacea MUCL 33604]